MKLYKLALCLISTSVISLSGCSAADTSENTINLKMIQSLTSPERIKALEAAIADFEKANPSIKVELISPPVNNADQKIQQMLQTKQNLDVVEVRDLNIASMTNNKWLMDITSDVKGWSGWNNLTNNSQKLSIFGDGKIYLIPNSLYQKGMFYRIDRLKEAGIDYPPTTYEDLYNVALKLTDANANLFGYSFRGGTGGAGYLINQVASYNGENMDIAKVFTLKNGKTMFSSQDAVDATRLYLQLFQKVSPPSSIAWGFPEMVHGFSAGLTSFLAQDPEVIATLDATDLKGKYAITAPMAGPTGYAMEGLGYSGWGVTSFTAHKAEAIKLIEFLSSSEQALRFAKTNASIPIVTAAANDPFFNSGAWAGFVKFQSNPKVVAIDFGYTVPWSSEWSTKADKDIQALLSGGMTPEQLMRNWDSYWLAKWAQK